MATKIASRSEATSPLKACLCCAIQGRDLIHSLFNKTSERIHSKRYCQVAKTTTAKNNNRKVLFLFIS